MTIVPLPPIRRQLARRRRATAAQARYRAHLKANEVIAPTVVTHELLELLLGLGWLGWDLSESRQEIGKAITSMLSDAAKRR